MRIHRLPLALLLLPTALSPALPRATAGNEWWVHAVAGSYLMLDGAWEDCAGALERAVELEPDWAHGWLLLGRAHNECGAHGESTGPLERALAEPTLAPFAHYELARSAAAQGEAVRALQHFGAAREAGFPLIKSTLAKDGLISDLRKTSEYKLALREFGSVQGRYEELADRGEVEPLTRLFRSLGFEWIDRPSTPCNLVRSTVDRMVELRSKGRHGSKEYALLLARARTGARAGDAAFECTRWTEWVDAMSRLDEEQCAVYRNYWKNIDRTGSLFRGHRFQSLMDLFVPAQGHARDLGDAVGSMEIECALGLTRECLVEYKTRGHDLETAWREGWSNYGRLLEDARELGNPEYALDAYSNRVEYLLRIPSEAIRTEFYTEAVLGPTLIEMAILDMRLPPSSRVLDDYRRIYRDTGVYPR